MRLPWVLLQEGHDGPAQEGGEEEGEEGHHQPPPPHQKGEPPRGEHPGEEEEVEAVGQGGVAPKAQAKAAQEGPFRPGVRLGHAPLKEEVGEEEEP